MCEYSCARAAHTPSGGQSSDELVRGGTLDLDHTEDGLIVNCTSSLRTHWRLERMTARCATHRSATMYPNHKFYIRREGQTTRI